ncbi:hypothetical protein CsatA_027207 [Cannabis sativa]
MTGAGQIAWENVCQSKQAGGIGFKKVADWNKAAMFKYIWAIATKEDNLWVKWIHSVYIKGKDWWSYEIPQTGSWYWRKIVALKGTLLNLVDPITFTQTTYKVADGYKWLCPTVNRVNWSKEVWNRLNTPKHSFVFWLAVQNRLKTRDRLLRFQIATDPSCLLCLGSAETCEHLFFLCPFSMECLIQVKNWLGWKTPVANLTDLVRVLEKRSISAFRRQVYTAACAALLYLIWRARNNVLWLQTKEDPKSIVQRIKNICKTRIQSVWPRKVSIGDTSWFNEM